MIIDGGDAGTHSAGLLVLVLVVVVVDEDLAKEGVAAAEMLFRCCRAWRVSRAGAGL